MPQNNPDFIIDPKVQLERDEASLRILLEEKASGIVDVPGMLVNSSKNPIKELFRDTGIDAEIAHRILMISDLKRRIAEGEKR